MQRIKWYVLLMIVIATCCNLLAQSTFKEITESAGLSQTIGHNVGVSFGDFNNDSVAGLKGVFILQVRTKEKEWNQRVLIW